MVARVAALGLLLVTAALLETTVFAALAVAGHAPSLVTLTVVGVALASGSESGATYGFAAGLLVDLLGGGLVGLFAFVLLLVGFGVGRVRPYLTGPRLAVHVVVGGAAAVAGSVGYGLLLFLLEPSDLTISALAEGTLVASLYSAAVAPFVVRPSAALSKRVEAARIVS